MYIEDIKEDNLWLMKGDCLERMKEIPDGSVDLILTDPPYEISNAEISLSYRKGHVFLKEITEKGMCKSNFDVRGFLEQTKRLFKKGCL